MDILNIDIPTYDEKDSPTILAEATIVEWIINRIHIVDMEKRFKAKCKGVKKKRILAKNKRNSQHQLL